MGQHGANLEPTWGQLGANLVQLGPTWCQLGPTWRQFRPARTKMNQRKSTWSQRETKMDLKIMQKPLFFLCFFNILKKCLEAYPRQRQTRKSLPEAGPSQKKPIQKACPRQCQTRNGRPKTGSDQEKPSQGRAKPGKAAPRQGQTRRGQARCNARGAETRRPPPK